MKKTLIILFLLLFAFSCKEEEADCFYCDSHNSGVLVIDNYLDVPVTAAITWNLRCENHDIKDSMNFYIDAYSFISLEVPDCIGIVDIINDTYEIKGKTITISKCYTHRISVYTDGDNKGFISDPSLVYNPNSIVYAP